MYMNVHVPSSSSVITNWASTSFPGIIFRREVGLMRVGVVCPLEGDDIMTGDTRPLPHAEDGFPRLLELSNIEKVYFLFAWGEPGLSFDVMILIIELLLKGELPLKPCFRDFPLAGPLTSPSVNKGSSFAGKEPILGREVCLGDCSVLLWKVLTSPLSWT